MGTAKSLMRKAKESQPEIYSEMVSLSRRFGSDVFRIVGQRFFKRQRDTQRIRDDIAAREQELAELKRKSGI